MLLFAGQDVSWRTPSQVSPRPDRRSAEDGVSGKRTRDVLVKVCVDGYNIVQYGLTVVHSREQEDIAVKRREDGTCNGCCYR